MLLHVTDSGWAKKIKDFVSLLIFMYSIFWIGFDFCIIFAPQWDISSVGLERCLDRAEVTGSNPVYPTLFSSSLGYNNSKTRSRAIPLDPFIKIEAFETNVCSFKYALSNS